MKSSDGVPRSPDRAALALGMCLLGSAASGCSSSSSSCDAVGCPDPITVTATVSGPTKGPFDLTFCKGATCESAKVDTALPEIPDTMGVFDLGVGASSSVSGELALTVVVRSAPNLIDGETLRLTVVDATGAQVLDWTAKAKYERQTVGGPGCGECVSMKASASQ